MGLEGPAGLPEVLAEFAARRLEPAEVLKVAEALAIVGVEVAEEPAGELAEEPVGEPGVEVVADQSAVSAVGFVGDPEVALLG